MVYIFQKKNYSKYIMKYSIKEKLLAAVVMGVIIIFSPQTLQAQTVTIQVNNPETAPEWALLQRQLLDALSTSSEHFYNRYFDERGYLLADLRWGGNDGPDDAIENVNRWPEIYALGGSDRMLEMYKKAYEGHVLQYTYMNEVNGTTIPYIKDGMYYKEFPTKMDWVHNSEGITVFNVMGLGDPYDPVYERRVRRFAEFYMGEDPGALNYDSEHKIIRSMFNGSRGPLLRKATSVDWSGDPSEIRNRYGAGHGEYHYEEFLYHFKDYHDTVGDHPQNLMATNLAYNAYILTGEDKYRDWMLEYVDAWYERMEENGWIIPSNIGLDGTIGGETDGKWYGGTYGWSFTIDTQAPVGGGLSTRSMTQWGFIGFMNAYMTTGDDKYLEAWRKQYEIMYNAGKMIDGVYHTPRNYGNPEWAEEGYTENDGWYNFTPGRDQLNKLELYYLSWKPEDRELITANSWLEYLEGNNPDYAVRSLRDGLDDVYRRMQLMREDNTTPDTRLSDDPMSINPIRNAGVPLIQLMGGGIYLGGRSTIFFTRLRYFNPEERRAGVPEDVAALVNRMSDRSVQVKLVNLNVVEKRKVVIQGGGYGEHQITAVIQDGERTPVDNPSFQVLLEPGSGTTLEIEMDRFVNKPTMAFPWDQ